jgi:hypothetical protein
LIGTASTLRRSDLQERGEAGFFAGIGFPHAEHVADISALHVTDHDHPAGEVAVADTPPLSRIASDSHDYCSYRYYRRQPAISLAARRPAAERRNTGFID